MDYVVGNVSQRRGAITGTTEEQGMTTIDAEVPLSEMFGYATDLRSMTQGKAVMLPSATSEFDT